MDRSHRHTMDTFTVATLPDLDVATLAALELFADTPLPVLDLGIYARPLVIGSGNALVTGRILFDEQDAIFGNESTFRKMLHLFPVISGATIISASGGKHATPIAEYLTRRKIAVRLFTTNPEAPARAFVSESDVCVFPKNREPFSYNVSHYLGMLLAKTKEDPHALHTFITEEVAPSLPATLNEYRSYFFLIPERFAHMSGMFTTKCEKLFGAQLHVRVCTPEQAKHARTIVPTDDELFVSFAEECDFKGQSITVPLPEDIDAAGMMAIGYAVIGAIQKAHPAYFKESVLPYTREASGRFNEDIQAIVE